MLRSLAVLGLLSLLAARVSAYYVPGTYPEEWNVGDVLEAHVSSLSSFETDLPFEYYTMPFCKPEGGVKRVKNTANPGTILMGLRIENSPYQFMMKVKETGKVACKPKGSYPPLTAKEVANLKHKIDQRYRVNLILDNLPVTVYDLLDEHQEFVRPGFELGYKKDGKYYIYNHLVFNILTYKTHGEYTAARKQFQDAMAAEALDARKLLSSAASSASSTGRALHANGTAAAAAAGSSSAPAAGGDANQTEMYMVVGFEVAPCSIKRAAGAAIENVVCGDDAAAAGSVPAQEIAEGAEIVYTYDVYWQDSKIKWASRWDAYLRMPGGRVHWFSILNSSLVVLVMATIVAMILVRTVRRDLQKYESMVIDGTSIDRDEAGWKLVTGDVFRAPAGTKTLAIQFGSGTQIIATAVLTLFLATLGFLSPASRGALLTTTMVLYVALAVLGGFSGVYAWALMERSFDGWTVVAFWVSVYYPGIVMAVFTLLNMVIHHTGSTGAVPVGMYFSLVAVWFLISIPLTFAGGFIALRMPIIDYPVKTNQIPRHVPPPPLLANSTILFFAAGLLPFGTLFIELYFAMTSMWLGYFYYLFGFVFVIGLITTVISAEISILCTYFQLCAEDYNWWWQSFYRGGAVALYVALYVVGFMAANASSLAGAMPFFIYLCYTAILVSGLYFAMGTVGLFSSFAFVYAIFKAVKLD